jgi:hypothetical protein
MTVSGALAIYKWLVAVITTLPGLIAATKPASETVATEGSLDDQSTFVPGGVPETPS